MDDGQIDHGPETPPPLVANHMGTRYITQLQWAVWPTDALIGRNPAAINHKLNVGCALSTNRLLYFVIKIKYTAYCLIFAAATLASYTTKIKYANSQERYP